MKNKRRVFCFCLFLKFRVLGLILTFCNKALFVVSVVIEFEVNVFIVL